MFTHQDIISVRRDGDDVRILYRMSNGAPWPLTPSLERFAEVCEAAGHDICDPLVWFATLSEAQQSAIAATYLNAVEGMDRSVACERRYIASPSPDMAPTTRAMPSTSQPEDEAADGGHLGFSRSFSSSPIRLAASRPQYL